MKFKKICSASIMLAATYLSGFAQYEGDPVLMGYQYNVTYNVFDPGLYQLSTTGSDSKMLWKDSFAYINESLSGREMTTGWLRNGRLCGFVAQYPLPSQSYYKYVERDLNTGAVLKEMDVDISSGWTNYFLNVAYCPDDDRIYGYGFNDARTAFAFKSAPASNPNQAIVIKEVGSSYPGSICYNHEYGTFVGVLNTPTGETYTNTLVSIDVNTGRTTTLYTIDTEYISDYKCTGGLIWVPSRHAYLWNFYTVGQEDDVYSYLMKLDPETKQSSKVRGFDEYANYMYFVSEDNAPKAVADAPQSITGFEAVTDKSKVDISFDLPKNLVNGSAISGSVNYAIYVDNVLTTSGSNTAGAKVIYSMTLNDGSHFIRIVPSISNISGVGVINSVFVGESTPLTPEDIVLTENELTWSPVVQGIAGNAIKDVTYHVYVNDKKVAETKDTKLSMSGIVLPEGTLTSYQAMIQAVYQDMTSKAGYSNRIVVGKPWTVPFTIVPTETQFNLMTQEDVDNNRVMWSIDDDNIVGQDVLTSGFSREGKSEDWIFLPKFTAANNQICSFSFTVYLPDTSLPGGKVEAWIGDAPSKSAMKRVIVPTIGILADNSQMTYSGEFIVNGELAGKDLYIGLGVTSDDGILSPLRFYELKVQESKTASIDGPEAVSNISVKRDENDYKDALVTFTMPTKTLSGATIPASASISANVNISNVRNETVSGKPGETVTARMTTGTGNFLISITPTYDGKTGLSANCVSALGFSLPGKVTNIRAAYDRENLALRLDWDAPLTDIDGNSLEGDKLSYQVWAKNPETGDFEFAVDVPYPLDYATMEMTEVTTLSNLEVGITTTNSIGSNQDAAFFLCQVGDPLSLPIDDDFNGSDFKFGPFTFYVADPYNKYTVGWGDPNSHGEEWGLTDDMIIDDGDIICGIPSEAGAKSRIILPKVSTVGYDKVNMQMNIWTGHDAALTSIVGIYPSPEVIEWRGLKFYPEAQKELGTLPSGSGYQLIAFDLTEEFLNQPWMSLYIDSEYPQLSSRLIISNYALTGRNSVTGIMETLYGSIIGGTGNISVAGYEGETVRVYALEGVEVASAKVVDNKCDIAVAPGIYIVKVANRSVKVVVR